jgi:hypothetical protein
VPGTAALDYVMCVLGCQGGDAMKGFLVADLEIPSD